MDMEMDLIIETFMGAIISKKAKKFQILKNLVKRRNLLKEWVIENTSAIQTQQVQIKSQEGSRQVNRECSFVQNLKLLFGKTRQPARFLVKILN